MTERESGGRADPDGGEPALDTIDLCDLDRFVDGFPHDTFRLLRAIAPVWFHPPTPHTPGGEGFWVLSRHRDVLAAAGDPTTFSSHTGGTRGGGGTLIDDLPEGFTGVLLNMTDDPFHRRFRSLLTPTVAPRAIAAMEEELRDRTRSIVASALDAEFVDLLVDVAAELPLQAAAALLGVPQQDRSLLVEWADATLDHADDDPADGAERAAAASAAMFAYGDELICRRRESPGDDLLSAAVHGTVEDDDGVRRPLRDDELQLLFTLLVAAGTETTRNTIAVGLAELASRPDEWRRLGDEPASVPTAVEELLRWASSTPYNRRTVTRDVEIEGRLLSEGDKVTLWWASANRDEAEFDRPDDLDLQRSPNRHLAFGHGTHFCLGARLARTEITVMLRELLSTVASVELLGPIEWTRSNKHTGVRHIPARLVPRWAAGSAAQGGERSRAGTSSSYDAPMVNQVTIVEVAPRDGLQSDDAVVSTAAKVEFVERCVAAGLRRIETASFVNPARVPQMADSADVMAELLSRRDRSDPGSQIRSTSFIGLVLNRRGLERALAAGCDEVNAVVPVSDTFAARNQGTDTDGAIAVWSEVATAAADAGVAASVTLTTSFGCPYEGEVSPVRLAEVARRCAEAGGVEIALADTIGVAVPTDVHERLAVLRSAMADAGTDQRPRVHFHNTRNTGAACVAAAVDAGVRVVDTSLGGIGGCPFAPDATGNVATEDIVYLLERMGHDTGLDLDALIETVGWMQTDALLDHPTPGLLSRAGNFPPA